MHENEVFGYAEDVNIQDAAASEDTISSDSIAKKYFDHLTWRLIR